MTQIVDNNNKNSQVYKNNENKSRDFSEMKKESQRKENLSKLPNWVKGVISNV